MGELVQPGGPYPCPSCGQRPGHCREWCTRAAGQPAAGPGEDVRAEVGARLTGHLIGRHVRLWGVAEGLLHSETATSLVEELADAVLAVPAVAEALAAVGKVRKLATGYAQLAEHLHHVPSAELYAEVATELRRALGEDGQ